jgi:hypothetical protein
MVMPNDKKKQDGAPFMSARAIMAKTPGPGVMLKIKTATKNAMDDSKLIIEMLLLSDNDHSTFLQNSERSNQFET